MSVLEGTAIPSVSVHCQVPSPHPPASWARRLQMACGFERAGIGSHDVNRGIGQGETLPLLQRLEGPIYSIDRELDGGCP